MRGRARSAAVAGAMLLALGCSNAGESRLLSVSTTGVVRGFVLFDVDGSRAVGGADTALKDLRVRLITRNGKDTIASGLSATSGLFRLAGVPVGTYRVALDTAPFSDTVTMAFQDSQEVTVLPADSVEVLIGIGYPHVSIRAARTTVPLGRRVWIEGIVLNSQTTFRDTTMHIQDTSAAIRTTRVIQPGAGTSDSVRLRGSTSTRAGQRTLDIVTVFGVAASFLPAATTVTTAQAASAVNGTGDAQQLLVLNATVSDTATVAPDFTMTVSDGSGALIVVLDAQAFQNFPPGLYIPGNKFDIVGLAVPSGAAGVWRLKPRSGFELVQR